MSASRRAPARDVSDGPLWEPDLDPPGGDGDAPRSVWQANVVEPRVKLLDIALFASQMKAMIGAGIPINEALGLLSRASSAHAPRLAKALAEIRCDVEEGRTLAAAFREHEAVFGRMAVEMIATGEATGTLERHLGEIAEDCEYRHANRSSLVAALVEPALIVVLGLVTCYILLTVSVPQFKALYEALTKEGELPAATRILVQLSDLLTSGLGVALTAALLFTVVALVVAVKHSDRARYLFHGLMLRPPLLGELVLLDAVSRACRTLAVVYRSVGEIPMGLQLASQMAGNMRIAEAFSEVGEGVYQGKMVWEAMRDTERLPELCVFMTKSGEETGQLDTLLMKLAETFETRVRYRRERMLQVLRYGLLLTMGAFVMGLMMAMYMPIFTLIEKMQH